MSELGLDAQKSDIRPVLMGNAAMDADARSSHAINIGRSGEAQGDHARLNLGGLSICPAIGLLGGQLPEMDCEKSAEAIVVGVHRFLQRLGAPKNQTWTTPACGKGWWRMSHTHSAQHGMSNQWFQSLGFQSLSTRFNTLKHQRKPPDTMSTSGGVGGRKV